VSKFLISALATILALGMMGGSFAYLSDTETSTGNAFNVEDLDLKLRDGQDDWYDGIGGEWVFTDMKPGLKAYGSVDMKNFGDIYADHMDIICSYTITDPPGPPTDTEEGTSADKMAGEIIITNMTYSYLNIEVDCLSSLGDANGNSVPDFYDLKVNGLDDLPMPGSGVQISDLNMTVQFNPLANNDFQGDTLDVTMIFTLNQHSSQ
jgi:predicted ribosomally synthesized peptide with SipW-like signal peptide